MILVFILFSFIVFAFFDFSSLRTHFWPLPFPSENFGGHGKKVLRETARTRLRRSFRLRARLWREVTRKVASRL
jgi:hypothetical protein